MKLFKQINTGLSAYPKAHAFIRQHRLYGYFVLPVVINLLVFLLVMIVGWHYAEVATDWLFELTGLETAELGDFGFLRSVANFFISLLLHLAVIVAYMVVFKYIVLILLAPVLAYVSEKTDELLTGRSYPFSMMQLMKDAFRGAILAAKNSFLEVMIMILLFVLSFIPVVGFVTVIAGFLVESYFYGFSMIDYYCERRKMKPREAGRFVWKYKGIATANGMIFNGVLLGCTVLAGFFPFIAATLLKVLFVIPVIGLSILPVYSAIAAMIAIREAEIAEDELQTT